MNNQAYYESQLKAFQKEKCTLPEAAALAKLIERAIKEKNYTVHDYQKDDYEQYDVIVTFNFAGDPLFGLFGLDDGEPVQIYSTGKGVERRYL